MKRLFPGLTLALLLCATAPAATVNTTMTVKGSGALTGTTFSGTADLTGIGTNLPLTGTFATNTTTGNYEAKFVVTVNSNDKLNVTIAIPATILATGSADAVGTITGGSGAYAGATGSFPKMPGTGTLNTSTFSLALTFSGAGTIVTGGAPPVTGPTITDVLDAGSYTKNIAQGSIFVVKGTTLSSAGFTQMSFPLPTQSSGVKITFTPAAGGTATDAYLVYLYNQGGVNQLAAVLPSTVATGNYNVTVTNGTTSAPFAVQVVQRKVGLITADSSGSGLAVIQNYVSASQLDIDRFTTFSASGFTFSPSKPGQILIAWATGLGPVTGGDNVASPGFDFNTTQAVRVIVGGTTITPLYAGRAPGLAGADQINFQLPANITTGCTVPFQVSVNGVLSQPSFLAIAPDNNSNACVVPGYTTAQLQSLDQGNSIVTGGFSITQFGITVPQVGAIKSDTIAGGFYKITGFQLAASASVNPSIIQQGSCQVIQSTSSASDPAIGGALTYLDAGNVSITGPAGSGLNNQALTKTNGSYSLSTSEGFTIPGQLAFTLPAGTYTLNGGGGPDVGSFTASQALSTALSVTGGLPASVNRSNPLTINWTGGGSNDMVEIIGAASTSTGTGSSLVTTSTTFICITTAGQRTFTVPASVLAQLPVSTNNNPGILEVASGNFGNTFTASLPKLGGTVTGSFSNFVGTGATVTFQ